MQTQLGQNPADLPNALDPQLLGLVQRHLLVPDQLNLAQTSASLRRHVSSNARTLPELRAEHTKYYNNRMKRLRKRLHTRCLSDIDGIVLRYKYELSLSVDAVCWLSNYLDKEEFQKELAQCGADDTLAVTLLALVSGTYRTHQEKRAGFDRAIKVLVEGLVKTCKVLRRMLEACFHLGMSDGVCDPKEEEEALSAYLYEEIDQIREYIALIPVRTAYLHSQVDEINALIRKALQRRQQMHKAYAKRWDLWHERATRKQLFQL